MASRMQPIQPTLRADIPSSTTVYGCDVTLFPDIRKSAVSNAPIDDLLQWGGDLKFEGFY